jgi:NAD(P)-dependent dehydrogenase (short-subunit alcohol dehydrogenase family)
VTGANRGIGRALTEALRALSDERLVLLRLDVTDVNDIRAVAAAA